MIRALFATILMGVCVQFAVSQPPLPKPMSIAPHMGFFRTVDPYDKDWTRVATKYTVDNSGTPPITFSLNACYYKGVYAYQEVVGGPGIYRVEGPDWIVFIVLIDLISVDANFPVQPIWTKDANLTTWTDWYTGTYNTKGATTIFGNGKTQNVTSSDPWTYTGVKSE